MSCVLGGAARPAAAEDILAMRRARTRTRRQAAAHAGAVRPRRPRAPPSAVRPKLAAPIPSPARRRVYFAGRGKIMKTCHRLAAPREPESKRVILFMTLWQRLYLNSAAFRLFLSPSRNGICRVIAANERNRSRFWRRQLSDRSNSCAFHCHSPSPCPAGGRRSVTCRGCPMQTSVA